jgi:RND superfamily putative drug exporter
MIEILSRAGIRAPRRMVAGWLLVLVAGVFAASGLFADLDADLDAPSSFESERVATQLAALEPGGATVAAIVEGAPVADTTLDELRRLAGVDAVETVPSDDGQAVLVVVGLGPAPEDTQEQLLDDVVTRLRAIDAPSVRVGSEDLLDDEVAELAESDAQRAEMISLPIALAAMIVVFGGLVAAGLPVLLALSGVSATMLALTVAAHITDISLYAVNVTLMLGIGLGIDYGLLIVSRFREERAAGRPIPDAIRQTMQTAGHTVVFSGLTVAAAVSGLLVFADPTIRSLGIAGIAVVLACVASALTLLPALLTLVGHRIRPRTTDASAGRFARLARAIQRRAGLVALVVAGVLIVLALPFTQARFDDLGARQLPSSSENRQVAEVIDARFTAVAAERIDVIVHTSSEAEGFDAWLDDVRSLPGALSAAVDDVAGSDLTVVHVHAAGRANGPAAQALAGEIRELDAPFAVEVGGDPAEILDQRDALTSRLPWALGIVVLATLVLLFLMTGSVVLPLKAVVMNVLSLGATFGAMVLVFQDGHLASWLGVEPPGALDLVMPVIVFLFAFGLSMDYEVFLLSRIREAWLESGDNDTAVAAGLQRSGRIVTSAALLVVVVFAGFVLGDTVALQQLGLGMAIAVLVDATIVRCLLVPAAMKLMGERNWWAPRPLARLHARAGMHETSPAATATAPPPATSVAGDFRR